MNWKLTLLLSFLALPGVLTTAWFAVPTLVDIHESQVPLTTLQFALVAQGTAGILLASALGSLIAPKVGLFAPVLDAFTRNGNLLDALRPQVVPGFIGGCIGAALIVSFYKFAPDPLASLGARPPLPLAVRLLYGGITEEILIRWGLMTALAWVGWRIFSRKAPRPTTGVMWMAIVVSALLFGVFHLPASMPQIPDVSAIAAAYIVFGNAMFGVVAGYLFLRYGLEAAIGSHVLAHLFAFAVRG